MDVCEGSEVWVVDQIPVFHLDEHGITDIGLGCGVAMFVDNPYGTESHLIVAGRRGYIRPLSYGRASARTHVLLDYGRRASIRADSSSIEQHHSRTQPDNGWHAVGNEQHRSSATAQLFHPPQALLLEGGITHSENLVDQEDLWLEM